MWERRNEDLASFCITFASVSCASPSGSCASWRRMETLQVKRRRRDCRSSVRVTSSTSPSCECLSRSSRQRVSSCLLAAPLPLRHPAVRAGEDGLDDAKGEGPAVLLLPQRLVVPDRNVGECHLEQREPVCSQHPLHVSRYPPARRARGSESLTGAAEKLEELEDGGVQVAAEGDAAPGLSPHGQGHDEVEEAEKGGSDLAGAGGVAPRGGSYGCNDNAEAADEVGGDLGLGERRFNPAEEVEEVKEKDMVVGRVHPEDRAHAILEQNLLQHVLQAA
eukprot:752812-Hanusia_phi.AAC.4